MSWKLSDIPDTISINGSLWEIFFVRGILGADDIAGQCDGDEQQILIDSGLSKSEKAKTLIHEILHAFEYEYNIKIPHKLIYQLEEPIYRLLMDNWRYIGK